LSEVGEGKRKCEEKGGGGCDDFYDLLFLFDG